MIHLKYRHQLSPLHHHSLKGFRERLGDRKSEATTPNHQSEGNFQGAQ